MLSYSKFQSLLFAFLGAQLNEAHVSAKRALRDVRKGTPPSPLPPSASAMENEAPKIGGVRDLSVTFKGKSVH